MGARTDSLSASGDFEEFDTLAHLEANFTGTTRRLMCLAAGTLIVKQSEGGTSRTLTMLAGVTEDICAVGFTASGSSGCVPVRVYR